MKIFKAGHSVRGRSYSLQDAHKFGGQSTMFHPLPDGSFDVGLSEWEAGGFPDPITGRTVYGWKRHVVPLEDREGEIISWSGVLPSGAKVTVFND